MQPTITLAEKIAARLIERRETIAIAESSTGGLIAAALLSVPGASAYFLGGAVVYPFEPAHLGEIVRWMRRYSERGKREMDLADASLYWLASETGLTEILTVDVSDFSRYRLPRGKAFSLL